VDGPAIPVDRIARDLGVAVRLQPFAGKLSGMLVRKEDGWVIGVNSLEAPVRQRFTIAHEIGHHQLHAAAQDVFIDRSYPIRFRDGRSSTGEDRQEIEANRFAAELLMPTDFLRADLANQEIDGLGIEGEELVERMAKRYQVSKQAMTIRLTSLGLGSALGVE
jgi:Zn-dependent peptidase ImmA (M78 family)